MRISEAFTCISERRASIAYRRSWHPETFVFPTEVVGDDGSPLLAMSRVDLKKMRFDWFPHSVDVRADDWECE